MWDRKRTEDQNTMFSFESFELFKKKKLTYYNKLTYQNIKIIHDSVFTWKFRNQILLSSIENDRMWSINGLLLGW